MRYTIVDENKKYSGLSKHYVIGFRKVSKSLRVCYF